MLGRFLSNIYDHRLPDAEACHLHTYHDMMNGPEACKQAWQRYLDWINSHVIGPPKKCEAGTVEQMESRGYIGIYEKVE